MESVAAEPRTPRRRDLVPCVLFGALLFLVYSANGRPITTLDARPAALLPVALLRGDGLVLDRFRAEWPDGPPYSIADKRGHMVSRYPVAIPLMALPLMAPQIAVLDVVDPTWERDRLFVRAEQMAKNAAAVIAACTGASMLLLLRQLGFERWALATATVAALGTDLWTMASQTLWQHGPAALALTLAIVLLVPPNAGRVRLLAAGGATAVLLCCRPQDVVFAAAILAWVVLRYRRRAAWFVPAPVLLWTVVVAYNRWYFGSASGGYAEIMAGWPITHGVDGYWTADVATGAAGTLVSPSRGLFVFCPWIALVLALLPATYRRVASASLVRVLLLALAVFCVQLATYSVWWAGHSFGPRFWIDVTPLFAILLGAAFAWSSQRCRPMTAVLACAGAVAIAIQTIGAFCYPSSWNHMPVNVDVAHERLWDWHDTELTRCWHECGHRLAR